MDGYKLFGMPQHFSTERWERLRQELELHGEMVVDVVVPMYCERGTDAYRELVSQMREQIQARLVKETGKEFLVTSTTPLDQGHSFRITRLEYAGSAPQTPGT